MLSCILFSKTYIKCVEGDEKHVAHLKQSLLMCTVNYKWSNKVVVNLSESKDNVLKYYFIITKHMGKSLKVPYIKYT